MHDPARGFHIPANPDRFAFDAEVSAIFDNMAVRSLPGYHYVQEHITEICNGLQFEDGESVWDMGCSTGTSLQAAHRGIRNPLVSYHGVDISAPMLDRMAEKFPLAQGLTHDFEDTRSIPDLLEETSPRVIIWNWTLQFLKDEALRRDLLRQSFDALKRGGVLILCEKWSHTAHGQVSPGTTLPDMLQRTYLHWRRGNGYSAEEIIAKRRALGGAMFPWSRGDAIAALRSAGFTSERVVSLYQLYNFGGLVAYK